MRHLGIACGGDDNYATGIAVALYSALSHLSADVTPTVYVLDGGLSSEHCKRLERVITRVRPDSSIVWCRISAADLAQLPVEGYLSQSAYLRLFLSQFVEERTKRVVYIDCDLLVVRDLSRRAGFGLRRLPVRRSPGFPFGRYLPPAGTVAGRTVRAVEPYGWCFNSGVLVIDWPRYAALDVEKKTLAFGTRLSGNPAVHGDQDMLNPVLSGNWLELPYTHNFFPSCFTSKSFVRKKKGTVLFSVRGVESSRKQRYFTLPDSLNLGITGRRTRALRCGRGLSGNPDGWTCAARSDGCCAGYRGEPSFE